MYVATYVYIYAAFHMESHAASLRMSKILNSKGDIYCNMNRCILCI